MLIVSVLALAGSKAHAGSISLDSSCWSQVESAGYLVRGDRSSSAIGARLWNLDGIRRDWQKSSSSSSNSCVDKVFKQAVKDQREYWDDVGRRHTCSNSSDEAGAETPCGRFKENSSRLAFMDSVLGGLEAATHGKPCVTVSHPSAAVQNLASDVVAALPATKMGEESASCLNIPDAEKRKPGEKWLTSSSFSLPVDCLKGVWHQLMDELTGLSELAKAWWKAGFYSGIANVARAVKDDPVAIVYQMFAGTYKYFIGDTVENFGCYSNAAQTEKVCRVLPKIALAYLTGKVINPAAIRIGKGIKAAKTAAWTATKKAGTAAGKTAKDLGAKAWQSKPMTPVRVATEATVINPAKATAAAASKAVAPIKEAGAKVAHKFKRKREVASTPEAAADAAIADALAADQSALIDDVAGQIIPENAVVNNPTTWQRVKSGAKATWGVAKKVPGFTTRTTRAAAPWVKMDQKAQEKKLAPKIDEALDQYEREKKEAEARWKATHPEEAAEEEAETMP